jgi:hypothetical protein
LAAPNDGLTDLPYDASGRYVAGKWTGAAYAMPRGPNVYKIVAAVAITAGAGTTIWTPTAGKKFRVLGFAFSVSAAASLILGDNVVGTVIFRSPLLPIAGTFQLGATDLGDIGILSATINNVLKLDVSANATVTGTVWGTEE